MTVKTPSGEVLSDSSWDDGPDTVQDLLNQLGTTDPQAVRELMSQPQWNDFSQALRQDVAAWLADRPQ